MSRLSKKPIEIPNGVTVSHDSSTILVKGPLGEISKDFKDDIDINVGYKEITVRDEKNTLFTSALVGTYASHIRNMIEGVTKGFEKKLIIQGTGYKANVSGKNIVLSLGYSHDIELTIPEGIEVSVEKDEITIKGIDKEAVGQFASIIRSKRKPEPYKGKGVRYHDEIIERKQGKKAIA